MASNAWCGSVWPLSLESQWQSCFWVVIQLDRRNCIDTDNMVLAFITDMVFVVLSCACAAGYKDDSMDIILQ